jgi:hypothetical protein
MKNIKGWQIVWVSLSLLLLIFLMFEHNDDQPGSVKGEYDYYISHLTELERLTCLGGKASSTDVHFSCVGLRDYNNDSKFINKSEVTKRLTKLEPKVRAELLSTLFTWIILISILYCIGLVGSRFRRETAINSKSEIH